MDSIDSVDGTSTGVLEVKVVLLVLQRAVVLVALNVYTSMDVLVLRVFIAARDSTRDFLITISLHTVCTPKPAGLVLCRQSIHVRP